MRQTGEALINWIAELQVGGEVPPRSDWNEKVDKNTFAPAFSNWNFGWLDAPGLIRERLKTVYAFPMVDRVLPKWTFGRITLLGDAAHPMYPIGLNGASQAILDADALGQAFEKEQDVEEALGAYEEARLQPTAFIVETNRKNGPEVVMQIAEERAPEGFEHINEVISQNELEEISERYKQIAGFHKQTLNRIDHD